MWAYAISPYSTGEFQPHIAKMILVFPLDEPVEPLSCILSDVEWPPCLNIRWLWSSRGISASLDKRREKA